MKVFLSILFLLMISACTEESRNVMFRSVQQNILGERLKVSYVDYGKIVKSWIIEDGKVTTGVTEGGVVKNYYYLLNRWLCSNTCWESHDRRTQGLT